MYDISILNLVIACFSIILLHCVFCIIYYIGKWIYSIKRRFNISDKKFQDIILIIMISPLFVILFIAIILFFLNINTSLEQLSSGYHSIVNFISEEKYEILNILVPPLIIISVILGIYLLPRKNV